jgi:hypothetical protein
MTVGFEDDANPSSDQLEAGASPVAVDMDLEETPMTVLGQMAKTH